MKNAIFTKTLVIMVFITAFAFAAGMDSTSQSSSKSSSEGSSPGSIYLGAGIGNTFFSSEAEDAADQIQEISENSTAWKIFGGLQSSQIYWF